MYHARVSKRKLGDIWLIGCKREASARLFCEMFDLCIDVNHPDIYDMDMTRKQQNKANALRNEWLQRHSAYDECEATVVGNKVICFAAWISNGRRIGEKHATFTVGPRGGVK